MKLVKLQKYFNVTLILAILVLIWGCGSDGGTTPVEVANKGASVSVITLSDREYVIQGDNMDGVAGIDLTINYESSTLSSPTVIQGGLVSGALMVANTSIPGTIRIAIITMKALSGNGQIANVSFTAASGSGNVSIASVKMIDTKGTPIL